MRLCLRAVPVLLSVAAMTAVASPSFADDTTPAAAPTSTESTETAQERSFSAAFDVTAASRYLVQGIDYSDGRSVLQPNLVASYGEFSAVCWANYQVNLGDINEVDLSLKATRTFGKATVSPGYTYLRYPNRTGWDPTHEIFADLSVESPLNPSLSIHADVDAGDGFYATLGLNHPVNEVLSFGTNVFYQRHYYGMTGVPAVELKASASFQYGGMSVTPTLSHFATTDNRDFSGAARVPSGWLIAINVVPAR